MDRLNRYFDDLEPEESISLEEESISIEEEEVVSLESESVPLPDLDEDDEILEAEVLDAEFVEEVEPAFVKEQRGNKTLVDQIKNPKVAAILLTLLVATGGWYWYVNNQLQPFTADDLRYRFDGYATKWWLELLEIR